MLSKKLAVQIIVGVVLALFVLTACVCVIGYNQFTWSAETQYEDCAYNTARTAATMIIPELLNGEIAGPEFAMRYKMLYNDWQLLADTQDATYIYLIRPDKSDYNHVEFGISLMNSSANYVQFPSGYVRQTSNEEYRNAYREICEGRTDKVTIFRDRGDSHTGLHITVMIPVKPKGSNSINWILCVQRQMERLNLYRHTYVKHVALAAAVIALLVLVIYGTYLGRVLILPVQRIAGEAQRFADEHTAPESPLSQYITAKNEIGQLAVVLDSMESQILSYVEDITHITQEREQIKAELNIAANIQLSMLPRDFPKRREFEMFATMNPAKEVGGDFYDFFMIDEDHLALVIADVSGKGVPASLFMVITKTLIKNRAKMGGSPGDILFDVNNQLCEGNDAEMFVTVWFGILELSTGKVRASNAGHEYPALRRQNGNYELFKTKQSPALATMEGLKFRESEFTLAQGDSLYVYTDGVAEATNIHDELFGTGRMLEVLDQTVGMSAEQVLAEVKRKVDKFTGAASQFDDITMMYLKITGGKTENMHELTVDAQVENLDEVLDFIDAHLEEWECPMKTITQINIAVEEIFVNIAHYAYEHHDGKAKINLARKGNNAEIVFTDSGIPYNPLAKPDPDVTLSAEERQIGGLGIYIVKKSMDAVSYEHLDSNNVLTIRKNIA